MKACQQRGRERNQGDREQEAQVNPGEVAVGPFQSAELRLLSHPEDAQGQKAHEVRDDGRQQASKLPQEVAFGLDGVQGRNGQAQDQKRHADRKDAVGETREPVDARAGHLVVARRLVRDAAHA